MGYFNYFIKCIIRNITYKLCKPKVLLTVLLAVLVLFVLHSTGYCNAWTDSDIEHLEEFLFGIQSQLEIIRQYDTSTYLQLKDTYDYLVEVLEEQSLDQQIYLLELQKLTTAIYGTVTKTDVAYSRTKKNLIFSNNSYYFTSGSTGFATFAYDSNHSYEISVTNNGDTAYTLQVAGTVQNITSTSSSVQAVYLGSVDVPVGATYKWLVSSGYEDVDYIVFRCEDIFSVNLYRYDRKTDGILGNLDNIGETMDKNNELQEESNKLQQEQNDILTNDEVETDSLEFATDDTANPTSDGFNTLFNTVYNAFCNTSSQPLTITLPYINETFTIQPNVVSNGMKKAGLGVVVNLINSFYYFSVCLFIYKDINKIIENLKSGNLTADCGNVKTEVL